MSDLNTLRQSESADFFIEVLERLNGDYPGAAALFALLSEQADIAFIPVSVRKLSELLGVSVPFRTLFRSLLSLEELGLIESKCHPNTKTDYHVNVEALYALLAKPVAPGDVIPGITLLQNGVAQNGTINSDCSVCHFEPPTNSTSSAKFMVELLNRLGQDYLLCAVLFALLARQANVDFVKASRRELSVSLGARVSPAHVDRVLATLESIDLVERQVVSKMDVRYRVDRTALRTLLARPIAPAKVIPGLTPLPALQRISVAPAQGNSLETFAEGSDHG